MEGLQIIARIRSPFPEKFGIPRQSGLVQEAEARIVFEKPFRIANAVRGLEGFSHIWLLWQFSENLRDTWSPTVRPPRLGGNARMGVFATRSPFRPNPIGLSCVRLLEIETDRELGPVLRVAGADLMDGTPIFDIKPYLPYTDSHPEAVGGFTDAAAMERLTVEIAPELLERIEPARRKALLGVLACDPRPRYQDDPDRIYGLSFAGYEVKFRVDGGVLTVWEVR
ncbi:MAG: tRNA (N6-threonylcarbamoyladenosine(37)-N6)-methyltransferase TrmO [Oscillospiraceae bacterium]|nr:tRNA (N6-threonylcarbamoyladenosine(37)-N6)-methyltransferase TrmO [Oscillospiraceae bacterium]